MHTMQPTNATKMLCEQKDHF